MGLPSDTDNCCFVSFDFSRNVTFLKSCHGTEIRVVRGKFANYLNSLLLLEQKSHIVIRWEILLAVSLLGLWLITDSGCQSGDSSPDQFSLYNHLP